MVQLKQLLNSTVQLALLFAWGVSRRPAPSILRPGIEVFFAVTFALWVVNCLMSAEFFSSSNSWLPLYLHFRPSEDNGEGASKRRLWQEDSLKPLEGPAHFPTADGNPSEFLFSEPNNHITSIARQECIVPLVCYSTGVCVWRLHSSTSLATSVPRSGLHHRQRLASSVPRRGHLQLRPVLLRPPSSVRLAFTSRHLLYVRHLRRSGSSGVCWVVRC
jgi:hypothetical protein